VNYKKEKEIHQEQEELESKYQALYEINQVENDKLKKMLKEKNSELH
jgi:hypothetical protein